MKFSNVKSEFEIKKYLILKHFLNELKNLNRNLKSEVPNLDNVGLNNQIIPEKSLEN